jgi:hypothetical protein
MEALPAENSAGGKLTRNWCLRASQSKAISYGISYLAVSYLSFLWVTPPRPTITPLDRFRQIIVDLELLDSFGRNVSVL